MKGFFRYDSGFWSVMSRVFDLLLLNGLWIVVSIPIVTIGASTTALCAVVQKMIQGESVAVLSGYFKAFRENWKQGTILWLIYLVCGGWLLLGVYACGHLQFSGLRLLGVVEIGLFLILVLGLLYVFQIQARFRNSVRGVIASAQMLALRYLPWSLLMLACIVVPAIVTILVEPALAWMLFLWIFLGASGTAYLQAKVAMTVFQKAEEKQSKADV